MTDHGSDPIAACAVSAIATVFTGRTIGAPDDPELDRIAACFVTIERDGGLRGCIGSLHATRTLRADIIHNAGAALRDPRLDPVIAQEWPELVVSVSVLSTPTLLAASDPRGIRDELRPGVDGLVLRAGMSRATLLPSVWSTFPDPEAFIGAIASKGGWAIDDWPSDMRAERYTTSNHVSRPPRPPLDAM